MWGTEEAMSEGILLTLAQPCQGTQCLRPMGEAIFSAGEAQRNGNGFCWSKYECLPTVDKRVQKTCNHNVLFQDACDLRLLPQRPATDTR